MTEDTIYVEGEEKYEHCLDVVDRVVTDKLGWMEENAFQHCSPTEYEDIKDSFRVVKSIVLQYVASEVVKALIKSTKKK